MEEKIEYSQKLSIWKSNDVKKLELIGNAFSSFDRICIMQLLMERSLSLSDIGTELNMAISSVAYHIDIMEKAGLVQVRYKPSKKGHVKICYCTKYNIDIDLTRGEIMETDGYRAVEYMPVGQYIECNVKAPCGFANEYARSVVDDPNQMFIAERSRAKLLWFSSGKVSYQFPNHHIKDGKPINQISFIFEICSEATGYQHDWPSDITVWVNDIELATFTSPGDFGGRRGKYTPKYWSINATQYGLLKNFTIRKSGVYIDGQLVNPSVTFDDLNLGSGSGIRFSIGIKDDAQNIGGVNLFGEGFGDHFQDIMCIFSEKEN